MAGDDDDEPTALLDRKGENVQLQGTASDLRRLLESLPLDDDAQESTPKVHALAPMLRRIQAARVDAVPRKARVLTLRSMPRLRARRASRRSRWLSATIVLMCGGALVATGFWTATARHTPSRVRVSWDLQPSDTSVTIGDRSHANQGVGTFPCNDAVSVHIGAPGRKPDAISLACGADVVLRYELSPIE